MRTHSGQCLRPQQAELGLNVLISILIVVFLYSASTAPLVAAMRQDFQPSTLAELRSQASFSVPPEGCLEGSVPMVSSIWGAFDARNGLIFIAGQGTALWVLNPSTNVSVLAADTPNTVQEVAVDPVSGNVYAVNQGYDNVMVVNGSTFNQTATISIGDSSFGIAYDPLNGLLYATSSNPLTNSYENGTVAVIDPSTNKVTKLINVGIDPVDIAIDTANGDIFVPNQRSNNVSVIDGANGSVIDSVNLGNGPRGAAFDAINGDIYVTEYENVSVVNGTTDRLVDTIPIQRGAFGFGITFDQQSGLMYVADQGTKNVTVIDPRSNTVIGNIMVGGYPAKAILDPVNGDLYVANMGASNLSVISPTGPCIHAIKEPGPPPPPPFYENPWLWLVLGVVGVVVLSTFVIRRLRRRSQEAYQDLVSKAPRGDPDFPRGKSV